MTRLTERNDDYPYGYAAITFSEPSVLRKLGQLEDIEEEMNFNLFDILNHLKKGVWLRDDCDNGNPQFVRDVTLGYDYCDDDFGWYIGYGFDNYPLSSYGKVWAFTKEELEKDNN